jgi:hypothetical protein
MTHFFCFSTRSMPQTHLPPSPSVPIRSMRCGHWKAGIKKSPVGKKKRVDRWVGTRKRQWDAHQLEREKTHIWCIAFRSRGTFKKKQIHGQTTRRRVRCEGVKGATTEQDYVGVCVLWKRKKEKKRNETKKKSMSSKGANVLTG